jgi:hypothetical protein
MSNTSIIRIADRDVEVPERGVEKDDVRAAR